MQRRGRGRWRSTLARRAACSAIAVALTLWCPLSWSQDVTEGALKGAFIYNFAVLTVWPADALRPGAPIQACILGDEAVASALMRNAKGREVAGHPLVVTTPGDRGVQSCHLLYVAASSARSAANAVASVAGAPVLTISDVDEFAHTGGIAQFFVEGGKMRFRVNLASAKRARIQLSSRLLSLAELVHD